MSPRRQAFVYRSPKCEATRANIRVGEVIIQNIFPEIAEPASRAYYLPIADAAYIPFVDEKDLIGDLQIALWHEVTHSIIATAHVSCIQRVAAFTLMSAVISHVTGPDDGWRLLLPSFVMLDPVGGRHTEFSQAADHLDAMFEITGLIQEIATGVIIGISLGSSQQAIKAQIQESVTDLGLGKYVRWDATLSNLIDDVIKLGEKVGDGGILAVAKHALNTTDLSLSNVLIRLRRSMKIAYSFPYDLSTQISRYDREILHRQMLVFIDRTLPEYNGGYCPLAITGTCHSKALQAFGEQLLQEAQANRAPRDSAENTLLGAQLMDAALCGWQQRAWKEQRLFVPTFYLEDIKFHAEKDSRIKSLFKFEEFGTYSAPLIKIRLKKLTNGEFRQVLSYSPSGDDNKDREFEYMAAQVFFLEALRQQLWAGKGPICLCKPESKESCPNREILKQLWDRTEPDPEWGSEWKQSRPACF